MNSFKALEHSHIKAKPAMTGDLTPNAGVANEPTAEEITQRAISKQLDECGGDSFAMRELINQLHS